MSIDDIIARHDALRAKGHLIGGVWRTESVADAPEIRLMKWQVFRVVPSATVHFYGYDIVRNEGRVSSPVLEWDSATGRGRTRSGRIYKLIEGRSGVDRDASYVLGVWLASQGLTTADIEDVTKEFR